LVVKRRDLFAIDVEIPTHLPFILSTSNTLRT
jgi:hypothetical protein